MKLTRLRRTLNQTGGAIPDNAGMALLFQEGIYETSYFSPTAGLL